MELFENKNEYLPLFRKYRPQSFKDVIGQEFTVKALENAIKLNKIANAYLFCGPRGTGKTSSARIFAKSLNCTEGPTIDPCQKCQSCLDVTNASGIDVIEIDAATNRGIDDAKELISKVQYAPMNGKYKIFIIDEVHMLSKEAFNALLKTFEEPPKNVIFILATTEPHKVIETIVSRCQRFDFRRITIEDIVKRLREISDIEKINITDEALFTIAKNVSGGMRDSLAMLDQASILGIEKEITKETIESLIGKLTFDVLYNLTETVLEGDIEASISKVETIYEKGSEPRNFVENYIEFLRNIVLILSSKDEKQASSLTLINIENVQKIKNNSLFEKDKLIKILDKIIEFYKEIKVSTNPYLWAELMIISTASIDTFNTVQTQVKNISSNIEIKAPQKEKPAVAMYNPITETTSVIKNTNVQNEQKVESVIEKAPVENEKPFIQEISKSDAVQNEPEPIPVQDVKMPAPVQGNENPADIWSKILSGISSIPAKFFYSGVGKLVNIVDSHITLGFVNENALSQAKSDNKYNPLIKSIQNVLGEKGSIEFIIVDLNKTKIIEAKPVKAPAAAQPQREQQAQTFQPQEETTRPEYNKNSTPDTIEDEFKQQDIESYPQRTREMLETFNGRVIE